MTGSDSVNDAFNGGEKVLTCFWDLAALDQSKRIAAAESLCAQLAVQQQGTTLLDQDLSPAQPAPKIPNTQLPDCAASVAYAVKRLLRGLESSRQAARQGFALALTTALERLPSISTASALDLLDSTLQTPGASQGVDARNVLLGRIFAHAAFAKAGRLRDTDTVARVVNGLVSAAKGKAYLREAAVKVLILVLEGRDSHSLAQVLADSKGLQALLEAPIGESHPETLWLALHLWADLPSSVIGKFSVLPAGSKPPPRGFFDPSTSRQSAPEAAAAFFSARHMQAVLPLLLRSSHSHPRLHCLWDALLRLLTAGPGSFCAKEAKTSATQLDTVQLQALWATVVEAALFTSSHERQALGLQLFSLLLPHLGPSHVPVVFSHQFLHCLSTSLSHEDSHLHPLAQKCVEGLATFLDASPDKGLRVAVVVALQRQAGSGFDRLANTDFTAQLLKGLDAEGVALYLQQLPQAFAEPCSLLHSGGLTEDAEQVTQQAAQAESTRAWVVEQAAAAARLPSCGQDTAIAAARLLAQHAFCTIEAGPAQQVDAAGIVASECQPPVSAATRQLCASRLITLVGASLKAGPKKRKAHAASPSAPLPARKRRKGASGVASVATAAEHEPSRRQEEPVDGDALLTAVLAMLQQAHGTSNKAVHVIPTITAEVRAAAAALSSTAQQSVSILAGPHAASANAFCRLLHLLHLYFLAEPATAEPDLARDLQGVLDDMTSAPAAEGESSELPPWMDRLMDVLLSLLAHAGGDLPFAPLREAIEGLFRRCCQSLTSAGMQDMLRVIAQPLDSGQRGEGDLDDEEEELEQDAAGSEDAAVFKTEESEGGSSAIEASSDGEDDEMEERLSGQGQLAQNGEQVTSSTGVEGSSGKEGDLTDDQMFRMDDALAAALKSATQGRSRASRKARREALVDFKFRVLSLLDCFLKRLPGSPLVPSALPPLLRSLRKLCAPEGHPPLATRLSGLIETRLARSKLGKDAGGTQLPAPEELEEALRGVRALAARARDPQVASAASACFQYLLRVALGSTSTGEHHQVAVKAWGEAVSDLLESKGSHLPLSLLADAARRFPAAAAPHWGGLVQSCTQARSEFQRQQALELVVVLLRLPLEQEQGLQQHIHADSSLVHALAGAVFGTFEKPARHASALKLVHSCVQALQSSKATDHLHMHPVEAALGKARASAPPRKVVTQLHRIALALGGEPEVMAPQPRLHKSTAPAKSSADAGAKQKSKAGGKANKHSQKSAVAVAHSNAAVEAVHKQRGKVRKGSKAREAALKAHVKAGIAV